MSALRILVSIVYIIVSVALVILVLMQEGKAQGLGTISGAADTYWGKNKGRSMEGMLVKITTFLAIAFLVLTALLNMKLF